MIFKVILIFAILDLTVIPFILLSKQDFFLKNITFKKIFYLLLIIILQIIISIIIVVLLEQRTNFASYLILALAIILIWSKTFFKKELRNSLQKIVNEWLAKVVIQTIASKLACFHLALVNGKNPNFCKDATEKIFLPKHAINFVKPELLMEEIYYSLEKFSEWADGIEANLLEPHHHDNEVLLLRVPVLSSIFILTYNKGRNYFELKPILKKGKPC